MESYKIEFIKFALSRQVLKFGEFTLKSGRKSPYFFNAGLFSTGADLARLGEYYAKAIQSSAVDFDVIFCPADKWIPIATSVCIALLNQFKRDTPVCFNRKEAKDHGEGGNLIGSPLSVNVLLVDDVITAGTAIRESMALLEANHAKLAAVFIALNRKEKGKGELSAIQEVERDYQCKVLSIIDLDDLIQFIAQESQYKEHLKSIHKYKEQYGI